MTVRIANSSIVSRLLVTLMLAVASPSYSELIIRVTQGNDQPTKIAIAPIAMGGVQSSEDVSAIVEADLARSGLFAPMERRDMLAFPSSASEVYYRDWRLLGAEYLVAGNLSSIAQGRYQIEFSLLNVSGQKTVFTHKVSGTINQMRDLAHLISDKVYEEITGIRGAFSTRLAYVTATRTNDVYTYRLNIADADGAREKLVLESGEPIMSPAWSANGKELAYVSFETGRPAIFRQNLVSAKREQLTNFTGLNGAPSWSPDGKQMALVLSKDGNPELYLLD